MRLVVGPPSQYSILLRAAGTTPQRASVDAIAVVASFGHSFLTESSARRAACLYRRASVRKRRAAILDAFHTATCDARGGGTQLLLPPHLRTMQRGQRRLLHRANLLLPRFDRLLVLLARFAQVLEEPVLFARPALEDSANLVFLRLAVVLSNLKPANPPNTRAHARTRTKTNMAWPWLGFDSRSRLPFRPRTPNDRCHTLPRPSRFLPPPASSPLPVP